MTINPFCLLCYSNRAKMKSSDTLKQEDAVTSPKVKMGYGMSSVKRLPNNKKKKKREAANPHAFADEQYGENDQSDSNLNDGPSMEEPNTDSTSDQARNNTVIHEVIT